MPSDWTFCCLQLPPESWKKDAIRKMTRRRAATLRFLERVPTRRITQARTQGKWSIQDVLVHIVAWEKHGCLRLRLIQKGKADQLNLYDGVAAENRYNARAVSRYRRKPSKSVLKNAVSTRLQFIHALQRLPENEIHNMKHQIPVSVWLPDYAWLHEQEHFDRIRQSLKGSKKTS
jgi:DinB superfamily